MMDALIIWDGRFKNDALEDFMADCASELSRFAIHTRIVQLSESHRPEENAIKDSMRAVLNLVHEHAPHHLITFGRRASALAALLRPTLKCQVWTNTLPDWLDDDESSRTLLNKLSQWFVQNDVWGDMSDQPDYLCVQARSSAASGILVLEGDPRVDDLTSLLDQAALDYKVISENVMLAPDPATLAHYGLMVMSFEASAEGRWIDQVNAYGMPVVLLTHDDRQHGIIEGQTGWVIQALQPLQLKHCFNNWMTMTSDTRTMIARYCRERVSEHSGLRQYCASLGYPERLEYKDFKIRG